MVVATRSRDGGAASRPKKATLEDFDVGGTPTTKTTTTGSSRKTQRARLGAGGSKAKNATAATKSSLSPSAATAANANANLQPPAATQRVRKRRNDADASAGSDNIDEDPPARPSAANAAAIRGNTTVSPSLPAQSKQRKTNPAAGARSSSTRRTTPKVKSGGRNTGVIAKNALKEQRHLGGRDDGTGKGEEQEKEERKPVVINRAPVLQLWGACVARVLLRERELAWETCLSIGAAIAALCAVSKGKAIGMIEPKDEPGDQAAKKKDKKQRALQGAEVYRVMNFPLPVKNGAVLLSGTPKNANEEQLVAKFGGRESYERVKEAMDGALESWQGQGEELGKKAFGMYEKFRPNVPTGARGWGRKGELSLAQVESAVRRS